MLYFEHNTPASKSTWSSSVYFRIFEEISSILDDEDFPIRFSIKRIFSDEEIYSTDLQRGCWSSHPVVEFCYAEAVTNKGISIFREDWHPVKHGCVSDSMFYLWCLKNPGSRGVAIGSNDGSSGDYVIPYMNGLIDEMVLVEASERTFERLKENYRGSDNVKTLNNLVSTKGETLTFFESTHGQGLVNSIYEDKARLFGEELIEVRKESVAINDLILGLGFSPDWLHLDVEGLDEDLVMALDFDRIEKPRVIIHERNKEKRDAESREHLVACGYEVFEAENQLNRIAILKNR